MSLKRKIKTALSPRSLRFRLTIFFVSFLAFTLVIFSTVLYRGFVADQQAEFDAALYNYATDVARSIDVTIFGTLTVERDVFWDKGKIFPFLVGQSFLQIIDRRGKILARSRSLESDRLPIFAEDILTMSKFQTSFRTIPAPTIAQKYQLKGPYRLISYPFDRGKRVEFVLQVGVPTALLKQQAERLLTFFLFAIPLTLIIISISGFYLSGKALAPVSGIIEKASRIGASKLSERLPIPSTEDELKDLSVTLNSLLDRLQKAFESQERFVADASHQLKTPLAILRGELDVFQQRPRSTEETSEFLQSASQELLNLSRMVDDLLLLARVDAGIDSLQFETVRMDEIIVEGVARLNFLAKEKDIKLRLDLKSTATQESPSDFEIHGDPDLLRTMLQNLIENAIKFSFPDKTVEVRLEGDSQHLLIEVRNWGVLIPEQELPKIFERFYRFEKNASQKPGLGLGLPIVRQIAATHDGKVWAQSTEITGTSFFVEIKKF